MESELYENYSLITGETRFGKYVSPEDEASNIKKCTILKSIDVTYSNTILGYNEIDKKVHLQLKKERKISIWTADSRPFISNVINRCAECNK